MKVFNNKFYILGFFSLLMMGGIVIYTFRTLFESLTLAFEVEAQIPESELRINRQNLDKAYGLVYEAEPTQLNLEGFKDQRLPQESGEEETEISKEEEN
jgi:hypothetical protein